LVRLEKEFRELAEELVAAQPDDYGVEEYVELMRGIYEAMLRHHGAEELERMSDQTVLKVIRSQVGELRRLKRIGKLMGKRERI
jgi:hypothetical protein